MRIRSHLLLFAFAVILPVAAFSVFLTALLVDGEQRTFAEGAIARMRSTMNAVDAQVQGQITALNALAALEELERDDLEAFRVEADRVLSSQPAWLNVILVRPDGRQVLNIATPSSPEQHPYLVEREIAERAASTGKPVVGSIVTRPGGRRGVNIAVPVGNGGKPRYVLLAFVNPMLFLTPIERQRLGAGWVSGLVDGGGRFIARIPPTTAEVASAGFLAAVQRAPEGWYRGRTSEGNDAYSAHITSSFTGWSIGLGIPAEEVLAGARHTAWIMGGGILASLALAAFLALWLGRRVARPVARIAHAAPEIAAGTPVDTGGLARIAEVQTVALALNEAAAAIRERQALVEREKQALHESDRAKDEFIAMMSHELRNPLAALSSASRLLELVAADDEKARHARGVIMRQTAHMARLIEDLLDTSRVVMGKAYLNPEVFNLAAAASSVLETWRSSGRLERHRVTFETAPVWIRADRSRVEQIISNLLDNALKFSPEGSSVRVSVSGDGSQCTLTVEDEGVGLTPELMERVFDLFFQSKQGLARKSGGMGIGLALVKRLVEYQGGSVSVRSEGEGRGSAFSVTFPCVTAPDAMPELANLAATAVPRRILLIDDNEDMRKTVAASLALQGHQVAEAGDGAAALALAAKDVPDVAIIDIGLPEIDGYEVARRLRGNAATRHIRLVALTGYGQAEDKQKAAAAGFDEHLTKPVDPATLEKAISTR